LENEEQIEDRLAEIEEQQQRSFYKRQEVQEEIV